MSRYCISGLGLAGSSVAWHLWRRGVEFSIVDDGLGGSSRVAAGLVQPVIGKNATVSWGYDEFFHEAEEFYREVEKLLEMSLWTPLESVRLLAVADEARLLPKFFDGAASRYVCGELESHRWHGMRAIRLSKSARLDTAAFVAGTRKFFADRIRHDDGSSEVIYCEGAAGLLREHPRRWPHRCAKGEVLTVRAPLWQESRLVSGGAWLVPIGDDCYKVGATYDWDRVDTVPTDVGRAWLEKAATFLGGEEYEVIGHDAGLRPIVRKSQPIVGRDPRSGAIVFNAMGSKGSLYAPGCARQLVGQLLDGVDVEKYLSAEVYFNKIDGG